MAGHIAKAAELACKGFVVSVDASARMVQIAARRNRWLIAEGRDDLNLGDSKHVPYPVRHFDKAYLVHTIYFWPVRQRSICARSAAS